MQKYKAHTKTILKTALGLGLVYYVLHSRMVDFQALRTLLFNPLNLVLAFLFLSFSVFVCTARWLILVRAQGLSQSYRSLLSLTMIGTFFNTFMPGSIGGDLIKAWFIAGKEPKKRSKAVFTVLLDRMLGLAVIVLYSAVTLLFYTQWLQGNIQLQLTAYSVWTFSSICILVAFLFFLPAFWNWSLSKKALNFVRKQERFGKLLDAFLVYREHLPDFTVAIGLSGLSVLGLIFFYSFLGGLLNIPMTTVQYFFVVPLALTVSAIPLLPGGIGTGQVAFLVLFKWMGIPDPEQGATLCTLVQIYTILFNCLGVLFYLRSKKGPAGVMKATEFSSMGSPNPCL